MTELVRDRPIEKVEAVESKPRNVNAELRAFAEWQQEITERVRAVQGLPPLYTPMPEEGACSPWVKR